jgi:hypothetical protein
VNQDSIRPVRGPTDQGFDAPMDTPWRYGFEWGPMVVERTAHIEGRGYVLTIKTEHKRMQVHVTEAGRKIKPYEVRNA